MRTLLIGLLLMLSIPVCAQQTVRLNFLYGSKPANGYKSVESTYFGGLKGGHVNIEVNGRVLDFLPGKCPLFPDNKNPSGGFSINSAISWDTGTTKWMTILIPLSEEKIKRLETIMESFAKKTPYDYAVFGMRCAAASYDVLSEIGLVKPLTIPAMCSGIFIQSYCAKKCGDGQPGTGIPSLRTKADPPANGKQTKAFSESWQFCSV